MAGIDVILPLIESYLARSHLDPILSFTKKQHHKTAP